MKQNPLALFSKDINNTEKGINENYSLYDIIYGRSGCQILRKKTSKSPRFGGISARRSYQPFCKYQSALRERRSLLYDRKNALKSAFLTAGSPQNRPNGRVWGGLRLGQSRPEQ
jgi:hypothetical protein